MRKNKIITISLVLSNVVLLTPTISSALHITNSIDRISIVRAETSEDIDKLIPDPKLRNALVNRINEVEQPDIPLSVDDLTIDFLKNFEWGIRSFPIQGIDSIQGLQYAEKLGEIFVNGYVKDYYLVKDMPNITRVGIIDIGTGNFDPFRNMDLNVMNSKTKQTINVEDKIEVKNDTLIIDLDSYIGRDPDMSISNIKYSVDGVPLDGEEYDTNERKIIIKNLSSQLGIDGTAEFEGVVNISFDEEAMFNNGSKIFQIYLDQPFEMNVDNDTGVDPDPDPDPGTKPGGGNGSGSGGSSTNIKSIDTTNIMTDQPELDIYNLGGNKKGTKKLTEEITDFETDKVNTVNGVEYYSLGNDEWVKADDVKVFHFNDSYVQTHGSKYKNLTKFRNTGTVEDRGLEKSTDWYTDRYAFFQGEWHHRVATHEWIHDNHVVEYQNINGVVHANETAALYNSKGKKTTDRALAKDSAFLTDKKATIDGKLMYRVATDEWVDADTVTFK